MSQLTTLVRISSPSEDALEPYRGKRLLNASPDAWEHIPDVYRDLGVEARFRLIGEDWNNFQVDCDLLGLIEQGLLDVELSDLRRWFMSAEEMAAYFALPELLRAWRGTNCAAGVKGLSWSRSRASAERFARRGAKGVPLLVGAVVRARDVFALKRGREEHELLVMPWAFVGTPQVRELKGTS